MNKVLWTFCDNQVKAATTDLSRKVLNYRKTENQIESDESFMNFL